MTKPRQLKDIREFNDREKLHLPKNHVVIRRRSGIRVTIPSKIAHDFGLEDRMVCRWIPEGSSLLLEIDKEFSNDEEIIDGFKGKRFPGNRVWIREYKNRFFATIPLIIASCAEIEPNSICEWKYMKKYLILTKTKHRSEEFKINLSLRKELAEEFKE